MGRPFLRLGAALAGYWLWAAAQGRLDVLLNFINENMLRFGLIGCIASVVLIPFWRLVPMTTGLYGIRGRRTAAAATTAVFLPFVLIAVILRPSFIGLSAEWFVMAGALLFLAASEEIVCRGFLLDVLSLSGKRMIGLALSSAIFAWFHVWNNHASVAGVLNILLAGVLFGLLRFTSGGLILPILLHWLWNLVTGMVFGWSVSGHDLMPTLFECSESPPWGAFGPEESLIMTAVMLAGSMILFRSLLDAGPASEQTI